MRSDCLGNEEGILEDNRSGVGNRMQSEAANDRSKMMRRMLIELIDETLSQIFNIHP